MLFEKLYRQYMEEYLLEGMLGDVPRKLLKVSTSIQDIPDDPPYGFWVDHSGNFTPVPMMGHSPRAEAIIARSQKYYNDRGIHYAPNPSPYSEMYQNNWIRVVCRNGAILYNTGRKAKKATQSQSKFLNFCKELYDMREVLQSDVFN